MRSSYISITEQKNDLRNQLLEERRNLSERALSHISKRIFNRLIEFDSIHKAKTIHSYLPIKQNGEVETWKLINKADEMGKEVIVPVMINGSPELEHYRYKPGHTKLRENELGIFEPEGAPQYEESQFDVIIVPMVGGDHQCNRLGYGRGYYDRFLKTQENAITIGVMPEICLVSEIPTEDHDIPLHAIITENTICLRGDYQSGSQ